MKLRLFVLSSVLAFAAYAADVTGKWAAEAPGRGGQMQQITFNLKADGATLTGTVSGARGESDISDGKVDGDTISFSVVREFQGNSFKMNYTGKLAGDAIQFKMEREGGGGQAREFTAKRQ